MGVYWPSMRKYAYAMVREYECAMGKNPSESNAITLFHVNAIAPKWSESIVEFLTTHTFSHFSHFVNSILQSFIRIFLNLIVFLHCLNYIVLS